MPRYANLLTRLGSMFKLGPVSHGRGKIRFFGMNIIQFDYFSFQIEFDDKLEALEGYAITPVRHRQFDEQLNTIEKRTFMSLNSSISWLETVFLPLCAFYTSYLQQKLPDCQVKSLICQLNSLKTVKRHGTLTMYPELQSDIINLVAFADASHSRNGSQLCYIIGVLYGDVKQGNVFHLLTRASHKSRRPMKSTPAAEIMAASESIHELIHLRDALQKILKTKVIC